MSDSLPTFGHPSLWGASWTIEVEAKGSSVFDDNDVRQLFERHFGALPDDHADALNLLRNNCRLCFGANDEHTAQAIVDELLCLSLVARKVPQSSEPHLKFPHLHAPDGARLDPPLLMRISGSSNTQDLEVASRLISHVSVMIPMNAVKNALLECRAGDFIEFPVSYREHAESLSHRLTELGYSVSITRSSKPLFPV